MAVPTQGAGGLLSGKGPLNLKFNVPNPAAKFGNFIQEAKEAHRRKNGGRVGFGTKATTAKKALQQGLKFEDAFDTPRALEYYEQVVAMDPHNVDGLLRCSKALSDLSLEPGTSSEVACRLVTRAVELSEKAMHEDAGDARTHLALAINLARLAIYSDNNTKVKYCRAVREGAETAFIMDPNEDMAYHILGRWHNEMASVHWIVKVAIDLFYGGLEAGSHIEAKRLFDKCIELNPTRMIHHIEMGRTHIKFGDNDKALQSLSLAFTLPVEDINALHEKYDAAETMKDLQNGHRRIHTGWRTVPDAWIHTNRPVEQSRKFPGEHFPPVSMRR